jgi:hypothetical protein
VSSLTTETETAEMIPSRQFTSFIIIYAELSLGFF